MIYKS